MQQMERSQITVTSACPKLQFNIFGSLGAKKQKTIRLFHYVPLIHEIVRSHRDNFIILEKRTSHGKVHERLISREEFNKLVD